MRIHKYALPVTEMPVVQMPRNAKLLCVQEQYGEPQVWAIIDSQEPLVFRQFYMVGTGHRLPVAASAKNYLGTFQMLHGQLVFHVFDGGES